MKDSPPLDGIGVTLRTEPGLVHGALTRDGRALSFAEAMRALAEPVARRRLSEALADAPFEAFLWECAPVARDYAAPFRFVLVDCPPLARAAPDPAPFRAHFEGGPGRPAICTFPNLGRDSLLVAPSPMEPLAAGAHLAAFVRRAPPDLVDRFWHAVPRTVERWFAGGHRRLWLSTSGLAVHWLHLRLDPRPKYYAHGPFRVMGSAERGPMAPTVGGG